MKTIAFLMGLLICIFTLAGVSATLSTDLSGNDVTLGSATQEASNYLENSEIYVTKDIVIGTTENLSLTIVPKSSFISSTDTVSVWNIDVSFAQVVEGASSTVTITARVPERLDAVDADGVANALNTATLTFNDSSDSVAINLFMQRINRLEFDDLDMMYNDESEKITDGEKIDDLKPGDGASFEFKVKNTYPSSSDVEIDDVDVTIEDDNNDLDIDEEESLGTIRENDDDSESISIDLDDDLDEDIYDLFIRVIGYDEFGARHGEQVTVKIEIEKEDDDVALKRADLNPDSVNNCDTRSVTLTLSIDNIGKHDQDGASLTVESTGLGYYNTIDQIELDEDEAKTKRFSIPISSDTKPGAYTFLITARTEDGKITDEDYMSILVTNCGSPTTTTPPATTTGSDVQLISGSGYTGITTAQTVVSGNDEEVSDDGEGILSIPALIILLVLVVVTIVLLTLILIKK